MSSLHIDLRVDQPASSGRRLHALLLVGVVCLPVGTEVLLLELLPPSVTVDVDWSRAQQVAAESKSKKIHIKVKPVVDA